MNINNIAECIYDILIEEYNETGTIMKCKISPELKLLLLIKGYFFNDKLVEDAEQVEKELLAGGYETYVKEFKILINVLKDQLYGEIRFILLEGRNVYNIIKYKPKTRDELLKCFKTGNEELDDRIKRAFDENFSDTFTIDIVEDVLDRKNNNT